MKVSSENLSSFIREVMLKKGMSEEHAIICAQVLTMADLRGVDSHGVARLSGYLRLIEKGRINPKPTFTFEERKKTMLRLNADRSIGLVSAHMAMQKSIELTDIYGSSWVGIYNSNHFGIAAAHAMMALKHDFIGFSMTNASPLVVPSGGKERMLGTNPICVAVPAENDDSFVLDMATSAAANGKLEIAKRNNKEIPEGWAIDDYGQNTKDPNALKNGGSLLPLGSDKDHGYHKGYGLGSWVDIFSGVLTGASFGPWAPPFVSFLEPSNDMPGEGLGHFVGCWDIDGFSPKGTAKKQVSIWLERFRNSTPINSQKVKAAGDLEKATTDERVKNGIPLNPEVSKDIKEIASLLNIKDPF